DFRTELPESSGRIAVSHGARGTPGMIVSRPGLPVKVQIFPAKQVEKFRHIRLHFEKIVELAWIVQRSRPRSARRHQTHHGQLSKFTAFLPVEAADFEEPDICLAAVQVPFDGPQQAWDG